MSPRPRISIRGLLLLVAACALFAWLAQGVERAKTSARRSDCVGHLKQIALALRIYHEIFGSFPPAYVPDANGRPMHSWRVLILPYLEYGAIRDAYDITEPWDGPNNRKLADRMPELFSCPNHRGRGRAGRTSYVAVVGRRAAFAGARPIGLADIRDDPSDTILIAESADSDIPWMEPRDLDADRILPTINGPTQPGLSSRDGPGVNVATADGQVHWLGARTPPEVLRGLLTRDGGEPIGADAFAP